MSDTERNHQEASREHSGAESSNPPEDRAAERKEPSVTPGESSVEKGVDPAEKDQGRRPTPARVVMEGTTEAKTGSEENWRIFRDPANDRDWVLTVTGRSTSGVLPLRSIRLMDVTFALAESPAVPLRRALCREAFLEGLTDDEVLKLFRRSRPHRSSEPKTRREESGEGRRKARRDRQD